jgi:hypothetical protein
MRNVKRAAAEMIQTAIQHYRRSVASLQDFEAAWTQEDKERHLASAVENAVAIVECFRGHIPDPRLQELAWALPRFRLLERVRIHNFHRRLVPYTSPEIRSQVKFSAMQGPIALAVAEPGSAAWVTLDENGPHYGGSRGGKVVRQPGGAGGSEKDIVIINGQLWDEFARSCVTLDDAVRQYLNRVPGFLDQAQSAS